MVIPAIRQQILEDLDQLPRELQRRVADFTHSLVVSKPKGTPAHQLRSLAGSLDERSAREMEEAIEEAFEQVDPDAW